ncbi:MAG: hypothetical protein AAGA20_24745, partial [Planctomycetota bacterium]
ARSRRRAALAFGRVASARSYQPDPKRVRSDAATWFDRHHPKRSRPTPRDGDGAPERPTRSELADVEPSPRAVAAVTRLRDASRSGSSGATEPAEGSRVRD